MKRSWLECLIYPRGIVLAGRRVGPQGDERLPVALLLDGQFLEYYRLAATEGWPGLQQPREEMSEDSRTQLLLSLVNYLSGRPDGSGILIDLAISSDIEGDLRVLAAVLGAMSLADDLKHEDAMALLERCPAPERSQEMLVLKLHTGFREAEVGRLHRGLERTDEALTLAKGVRGEVSRTLYTVARFNEALMRSRLGQIHERVQLPSRSRVPALVQLEELEASGLSKYLEEGFVSALLHARDRSVRWQAEDPVDSRLYAALLRAECLADLGAVQEIRRLLGRYRALGAISSGEGQVDGAIHLLRRAQDSKGIADLGRVLRSQGPLAPFARVVQRVASARWSPSDMGTVLPLLTRGAVLLSPDRAQAAAAALRTQFESLSAEPLHRHGHEVLRTLAALIRDAALGDEELNLASWFLGLARVDDALVLQELASVISNLHWESIPAAIIEDWFSYADEFLASPSDKSIVARSAMMSLAEVHGQRVHDVARKAFLSRPNLGLGVLVTSAIENPTSDVVDKAAEVAASLLERKREEAAGHRHTVGVGYDPGSFLAFLLLERGADYWRPLVNFLLDGNVPVGEKVGATDALLSRLDAVSPDILQEFVSKQAGLLGSLDPLFGREEDRIRLQLRFLGSLDNRPQQELLASLINAANDSRSSVRLVACEAVSALSRNLSHSPLLVIALGLAHDRDVSVRAQAGYALASVTWQVDEALAQLADLRLQEHLNSDGADTPWGTLIGMRDGGSVGREFPDYLWSSVRELANSHPANAVRQAAASLAS